MRIPGTTVPGSWYQSGSYWTIGLLEYSRTTVLRRTTYPSTSVLQHLESCTVVLYLFMLEYHSSTVHCSTVQRQPFTSGARSAVTPVSSPFDFTQFAGTAPHGHFWTTQIPSLPIYSRPTQTGHNKEPAGGGIHLRSVVR